MFVANRMTKNPITVQPGTKIDEAAALMKKNKVRRLPVVDEGKLVGFISDKDIMRVSPSPATTLSKYEISSLLAQMCGKDIMASGVIAVREDATIEEAALLMANNKIGGLPVVSDVGVVVGVITETDVFHAFVDVMGLADGKTRLTIEVDNKVGVVRDLAGIFADQGFNIDSLVTCKKADGKYDIIVRGDFPNVDEISAKLAEHGYNVIHSTRIGH